MSVKLEQEAAPAAPEEDTADRTIVTKKESGETMKDDCSELTDHNVDNDESCPRSFPRKVSALLFVSSSDRPRTVGATSRLHVARRTSSTHLRDCQHQGPFRCDIGASKHRKALAHTIPFHFNS
jgi:hypothetical protein